MRKNIVKMMKFLNHRQFENIGFFLLYKLKIMKSIYNMIYVIVVLRII